MFAHLQRVIRPKSRWSPARRCPNGCGFRSARATWTRRLSFRSLPMLDSLLRPVRAQGSSGIRGSSTGTVYQLVHFVRETLAAQIATPRNSSNRWCATLTTPLAVRHLDCHSHCPTQITLLFYTTCTHSTSVSRVGRFASTHSPHTYSLQSLLWSSWQATARWLAGLVWDRLAQSFPLAQPSRGRTHAANGASHR